MKSKKQITVTVDLDAAARFLAFEMRYTNHPTQLIYMAYAEILGDLADKVYDKAVKISMSDEEIYEADF